MALKILKNEAAREKYTQFLFNDEVKVCMNFTVQKSHITAWNFNRTQFILEANFKGTHAVQKSQLGLLTL